MVVVTGVVVTAVAGGQRSVEEMMLMGQALIVVGILAAILAVVGLTYAASKGRPR